MPTQGFERTQFKQDLSNEMERLRELEELAGMNGLDEVDSLLGQAREKVLEAYDEV